jgi:hypothetical protein
MQSASEGKLVQLLCTFQDSTANLHTHVAVPPPLLTRHYRKLACHALVHAAQVKPSTLHNCHALQAGVVMLGPCRLYKPADSAHLRLLLLLRCAAPCCCCCCSPAARQGSSSCGLPGMHWPAHRQSGCHETCAASCGAPCLCSRQRG